METCVIESQKMYISTPKSITWRKHVVHDKNVNEFDLSGIEFDDLQKELCPRISANDLIEMLKTPENVAVLDIRSSKDFTRHHIKGSFNIPFNSVCLGDTRLESLNIQDLGEILEEKWVVVVISLSHENAILVRIFGLGVFKVVLIVVVFLQFSKFLVDCCVARVAVLHNGFNILHAYCPNVLTSS